VLLKKEIDRDVMKMMNSKTRTQQRQQQQQQQQQGFKSVKDCVVWLFKCGDDI